MNRQEVLVQQQKVLLELLGTFDCVCKKHEIKYQLFAGSALGAIRHQGIIPWDDDLDVVMLRKDYERFLEVAPKELDEKYYLQAEFSDHWPMFFSKLRKNNTTFLERQQPKDKQMHQGIYIDIFPCDNLSDNSLIRYLQFFASKIIIAKSLDQRGYLTNSFIKKCFIFICKLLPSQPFIHFVQMKNKDTKDVHTFFGAAHSYKKNIYPKIWFNESIEVTFNDYKTYVTKYYDELLTKLYNEYMIEPSEEEKVCKVHGEIIDVNKSYTEYLELQKDLKFENYTRSIR